MWLPTDQPYIGNLKFGEQVIDATINTRVLIMKVGGD